jgi:hypothetical protein
MYVHTRFSIRPSEVTFNRQRAGLGDEKLIDRNILATLLAVARLLNTAKRSLRGRLITRVEADHAGLQVLKHPPQAVDILGEGVACEAHAGIVREPHGFLFCLE